MTKDELGLARAGGKILLDAVSDFHERVQPEFVDCLFPEIGIRSRIWKQVIYRQTVLSVRIRGENGHTA